jgi:DNA-binding MarR family transcriptional regulator
MSIEVMVWVLKQEGVMTTNEKFVLLGIANHAGPTGKNAFPSVDTLSGYTELSRSTVNRAIKGLIDKGLLECVSGGGRRSNTYAVLTEPAGGEVIVLRPVEATQGTLPAVIEVAKPKRVDGVWDAIMAACGVNTQSLNSQERGRYNKAVKLLKESGATPDEIHARVKVYRRKFKGAAITPIAVANHWSELDPNNVPIEDVQDTPKGWDAIRQVREERNGPNTAP